MASATGIEVPKLADAKRISWVNLMFGIGSLIGIWAIVGVLLVAGIATEPRKIIYVLAGSPGSPAQACRRTRPWQPSSSSGCSPPTSPHLGMGDARLDAAPRVRMTWGRAAGPARRPVFWEALQLIGTRYVTRGAEDRELAHLLRRACAKLPHDG